MNLPLLRESLERAKARCFGLRKDQHLFEHTTAEEVIEFVNAMPSLLAYIVAAQKLIESIEHWGATNIASDLEQSASVTRYQDWKVDRDAAFAAFTLETSPQLNEGEVK